VEEEEEEEERLLCDARRKRRRWGFICNSRAALAAQHADAYLSWICGLGLGFKVLVPSGRCMSVLTCLSEKRGRGFRDSGKGGIPALLPSGVMII